MGWTASAFDWTDEAIDSLKRQRSDGLSAAVIAGGFGITRSAVLGKIHRLGLAVTKTQQRVPRATRKRGHDGGLASRLSNKTPPPMEPPPPPPMEPINAATDRDIPLKQRRSLLDLTNETCRWPLGDGPAVWFCGSPSADCDGGSPYCPQHSARAHTIAARSGASGAKAMSS